MCRLCVRVGAKKTRSTKSGHLALLCCVLVLVLKGVDQDVVRRCDVKEWAEQAMAFLVDHPTLIVVLATLLSRPPVRTYFLGCTLLPQECGSHLMFAVSLWLLQGRPFLPHIPGTSLLCEVLQGRALQLDIPGSHRRKL